jgi:hypothetical protein
MYSMNFRVEAYWDKQLLAPILPAARNIPRMRQLIYSNNSPNIGMSTPVKYESIEHLDLRYQLLRQHLLCIWRTM